MADLYPAEEAKGKLQPKEAGRHRWIAQAVFALDTAEVAQVAIGNRVNLDKQKLMDIMVGCIDCEQPFNEDTRRTKCEAEEFPWQT
jgi:hypothetical protein